MTKLKEPTSSASFLMSAKKTIQAEREAVFALEQRLGPEFDRACELILSGKGRVVVTGVGKSGHIAHKISATLASTGTPAFFIHPAEASHGDLGMVVPGDIVLAISNSGNASEIIPLLPNLKRLNTPLIVMTANPESPLGLAADVILDISVQSEACPLNLAPTSSTTVTLVLGDALAVALLEARGFTKEDFALSHPGGKLGKRLLLTVKDLMHSGNKLPVVLAETPLLEALKEMSEKGLGMTTVLNEQQQLLGIFTDGDLRRTLDAHSNVHELLIKDVMTQNPLCSYPHQLAADALDLMEGKKIMSLVVIDEQQKVVGVLHMHDLISAGLS